jgi:hypothetical protein
MVPPVNVALKIPDQPVRISKTIRHFRITEMPVIAFAGFVVVTDDTLTVDDISQPVFEAMR